MNWLALEFSSSRRSVAVLESRTGGQDARLLGSASESRDRAAKPFALIESALAAAGLEREAIERIAVGLGPGSLAGIRSAIASAQGWHLARGVGVAGVSTMDALALQSVEAGAKARFHVAIDAQRDEFFLATYVAENGHPRATEPLRIVTLSEAREYQRQSGWISGPGLSSTIAGAVDLFPDAWAVGRIALREGEDLAHGPLEPINPRITNFVKLPPRG